MGIRYGMIEERYDTRVSYGIAVEETEDGELLFALHDIASDRDGVEALIERCNRSELSLLHINDAVEDFLTA